MILKDPLTHTTQRITDDHAAKVASRTITLHAAEGLEGNAYNFNTGVINLTNAATTNVLVYVKNTSTDTYVVPSLVYLLGISSGGSGNSLVEILRNPTNGSIVTDAEVQAPSNRNYGSSNTLIGDFFKASAEGKNITDGTVSIESLLQTAGGKQYVISTADITLPPGASFAVRYTTPTGNTSQDAMIAFGVFKKTLGT